MRKGSIILTIFSILLNQINGQMELIAGHALFRNGDRTPFATYPTDPMKEKDWPNGFTQLTAIGIEQSYRLGVYFRTRYGSLLNPEYNRSEIYVRSADYDLSLMSAQSNLAALYPLPKNSESKVPFQPVPIHTVPITQDFLLGINTCPKYKAAELKVYQSEEVKKLSKDLEPFFKQLNQWANLTKPNIITYWSLADTIFVESIYNKQPSWATADVQKLLLAFQDRLLTAVYGADIVQRTRGGPIIQDMWQNMNRSTKGDSYFKLKMYSVTDVTINAVLAFLGVNYAQVPAYASSLFVELYRNNSNYFVKVAYLNVTDSKTAYEHVLKGCADVYCPFDKFTSIYQPRFPGSVDAECVVAPTSAAGGGKMKIALICLIIAVVVLAIIAFLLLVYSFSKRSGYEQPLVSNEASTLSR